MRFVGRNNQLVLFVPRRVGKELQKRPGKQRMKAAIQFVNHVHRRTIVLSLAEGIECWKKFEKPLCAVGFVGKR